MLNSSQSVLGLCWETYEMVQEIENTFSAYRPVGHVPPLPIPAFDNVLQSSPKFKAAIVYTNWVKWYDSERYGFD